MNPSTHLSDPSQVWWDPDARLEAPLDDAALHASWSHRYPNQAPAAPYHEIPHDQHGYGHQQVHSEEFQPRSHRSRRRPEQNSDHGGREYPVNSHRPIFSVQPGNVSRTPQDGLYGFEESCHEFVAGPNAAAERTRRRPRQDRHYPQEVELGGNYTYEAEGEYGEGVMRGVLDVDQQGYPDVFTCSFPRCGNAFMDKNSLKKHEKIHGARMHSCGACGADFHTSRDLRRHQETIHRDSEVMKSYVCNVRGCGRLGKPFSRKDNARQHVARVHEIFDGVDDMIEEIIGTSPAKPSGSKSTQFRAGHRTRGSSSTDDTTFSTVSYDSNPGYHSHEDAEADDPIARYTYLEEYDSDLDINHDSRGPSLWQTQHGERGPERKYSSSYAQSRGRSKSDAQGSSRGASHLEQNSTQGSDFQPLEWRDRSHCYDDRSAVSQFIQEQIKEESPVPDLNARTPGQAQRRRRPGRAGSPGTKQSRKHPSDYDGKVYRSENPNDLEPLEDVFDKVLHI